MKIGIFDPYLDTLGGGEKYMLTMASCLSKEHTVSIFWDLDKTPQMQKKAEERFRFDFTRIKFVSNIFSPSISILERIKRAREYDIIIYLSDGSMPFILTKNLIMHFQFPVEWVNGRSLFTKLKLWQVRAIICNSNFTKSYIDKTFQFNSAVLYPPVDIIDGKDTKKENIILHVGRFGIDKEGKNFKKQDVMIDAFKQMITHNMTGWRFVLVISVQDEDKEKLQELQQKAKGFSIDIIINPKNDQLVELYKKAKIYWHASGFGEDLERNPERAEHFGIATAEAMSAGEVPIVINAGGQKEIVQDGKNGFLWSTVENLIEKTTTVMHDEKLWKRLSNQASEDAKKFNKDRFCREINVIIEKKFGIST